MIKPLTRLLFTALIGVGFAQSHAQATPITFAPGDILRIEFTTDPVAAPCPGTCDMLQMFFASLPTIPPGTIITASLYTSGGTLLGTVTGEPVFGSPFQSATSLYTLGTTIDFTPFETAFTGYYDVTTTEPISVVVDSSFPNVTLGHGLGSGAATYDPATAQITSASLVTPEPSYAGLLGVLLAGTALSRRFRRSRAAA